MGNNITEKVKDLLEPMYQLGQENTGTIFFLLAIGLALIIGIKLLKTVAGIIKWRIAYHYAGILIFMAWPKIETILTTHTSFANVPVIGPFNLSQIIVTILTLSLTRLIVRKVLRIF